MPATSLSFVAAPNNSFKPTAGVGQLTKQPSRAGGGLIQALGAVRRSTNSMRIGRTGYAVGNILLVAAAFSHRPIGALVFNHTPAELADTIVLGCVVVTSIFLAVLRCHDFNETVWNNFWTDQIPFVGQFLATWELLTKPGTPGMNSYGAQPPF